jgi:thiol:disulfide interchange protein
MSQSPNRWLTTLRYTAARLLLWLAVWAVLQFLTPVKGLLAVILGLLISSAISIIVLDRQRDIMSEGIGAFFGSINQKIANSAAAEDAWQDEIREGRSGPSQNGAANQAVDQNENAALLERNDQLGSGSTTGDNAHGLDGENKTE